MRRGAAGLRRPPPAAGPLPPPPPARAPPPDATAAVAPPSERLAVAEPRGEPFLAPGLAGIRVRATDEHGAPLATAELSWGSGTDYLAMTDARGEARLQLRPPGDGVRLQFALTAGGRAVRLASAVVQVGVWSDLGTLLLPRAVAVRGRVVAPESAPVAGATGFVTAAPLAPAGNVDPVLGPAALSMFACAPVRTDSDGAFALEVPAVAVCVVAVADEREFVASRPLELGQGSPGSPIAPAPMELCCP